MEDIPSLLESAVVYAAMTDYPTPSGFLTPLPAYPVREMCRAVDRHPSGTAAAGGGGGDGTLLRVWAAMDVYYNHTGAAARRRMTPMACRCSTGGTTGRMLLLLRT